MPNKTSCRKPLSRCQPKSQEVEDFLQRFRCAAFAIAFDRLGSLDDAADVAQEAVLRTWQHFADVREPDALPAWLRTVTLNLCRERWRSGREDCAGLEPAVGRVAEDTCEVAVRREMIRQLHRALLRLPENNRLALIMHVMHDLSYGDIARVLQIPVASVEGRIHRARRQLRRHLAGWVEDILGETGRDCK